jgi:hypothetical protein
MQLDKYHLNLAGEYRVTAELLKRGIFATITYGNKKGADIYAIGAESRKAAVIEVKASNSQRFVTGFYQKYREELTPHPDFWVLYRLGIGSGEEEFFVLSHAEMAHAQGERNYPGQQLAWAEHAMRASKGVDNVIATNLTAHRDRWDKVVDFLASS